MQNTDFSFKLKFGLLDQFRDACKPVSMSKILRGLIRAFITGKIKQDDLDLED